MPRLIALLAVALGLAILAPQLRADDEGSQSFGIFGRKMGAVPQHNLKTARRQLNDGQYALAVLSYQAYVAGASNPDKDLRAEYAYALAKAGLRDTAFLKLDELSLGGPLRGDARWYAADVFSHFGYNGIAKDLASGLQKPSWIHLKKPSKGAVTPPAGDYRIQALRANRLGAQNRPYLASALFEDLIDAHPNDFLLYLGLSLSLQKIGAYKSAEVVLDKAAILASPTGPDKGLIKARRIQLRLAEQAGQGPETGLLPSHFLAFVGGQFSSDSASFNARLGYFVTPVLDANVSLGVSGANDTTNFTLGAGAQYYWPQGRNRGVLGATLGVDSSTVTCTISPGLTTPQGSYYLDVAFSSSGTVSLGITIGDTIYFGGWQ